MALMRDARHPLTLLAVQILFGLFPVAAKKVFAGGIEPLPVLGLRLAGAAFFLLALHLVLVRNPVPMRTEWRRVLVLAFFGVIANMGLFIVGLNYTTAVNAVVVITTIPVFTYGLAVVMGREALGRRRLLGIAVALAGVLVLIGASYQANPRHALGDFLVLLNAMSYSTFLVLARPLTQKYDALSLTAWMFLLGALVFLPLGLALGLRGQVGAASSATMAWMGFIILGATVLTYVLNARVLRHVPASTVAIFTYVQPLFTAVAAYLLLGDAIRPNLLPAAALVFAGVWLVASRRPPEVLEGQAVAE